jgi:hypothetical protein
VTFDEQSGNVVKMVDLCLHQNRQRKCNIQGIREKPIALNPIEYALFHHKIIVLHTILQWPKSIHLIHGPIVNGLNLVYHNTNELHLYTLGFFGTILPYQQTCFSLDFKI